MYYVLIKKIELQVDRFVKIILLEQYLCVDKSLSQDNNPKKNNAKWIFLKGNLRY